ncbi:MAG: hypothetical protein SFV18_06145 [Bryobacteraceae bacterium]|nr:hypothetical protein [Bryobacteraceae bacterium]
MLSLVILLLAQTSASTSPSTDSATNVGVITGAVLPKEVPWQPLTPEQRWRIYLRTNFTNPGALFRALGSSAGDHANDRPPEWGQGMEGYSRRAANRFAIFTMQGSIQAATAAAMGYDVRFQRCKCEGGWNRVGHAMKQSFVMKNREGKWRPNIPGWTGGLAATSIAVYGWYPSSERNFRQVYQAGVAQLVFPLAFNVVNEFIPDIQRVFKKKKKTP